MVDLIGSRPAREALNPVAAVKRVQRASTQPSDLAAKQLELSAIAFDYDKAASVNEKRVEEVRRAVRNGTYPISPETIADRLLALKLNWSPKK